MLRWSGCLNTGGEALARGAGIGAFIGLTPTVGFQTVLMIAGCMLLRGNFPAAFAVSWVSNPVTMAPLYWLFYELGAALYGAAGLRWLDGGAEGLSGPTDEMLTAGVGSLLLAFPVAALVYFLMRAGAGYVASRRRRAASPARAGGAAAGAGGRSSQRPE